MFALLKDSLTTLALLLAFASITHQASVGEGILALSKSEIEDLSTIEVESNQLDHAQKCELFAARLRSIIGGSDGVSNRDIFTGVIDNLESRLSLELTTGDLPTLLADLKSCLKKKPASWNRVPKINKNMKITDADVATFAKIKFDNRNSGMKQECESFWYHIQTMIASKPGSSLIERDVFSKVVTYLDKKGYVVLPYGDSRSLAADLKTCILGIDNKIPMKDLAELSLLTKVAFENSEQKQATKCSLLNKQMDSYLAKQSAKGLTRDTLWAEVDKIVRTVTYLPYGDPKTFLKLIRECA